MDVDDLPVIRRAETRDVPALVQFRVLMMADMGEDFGADGPLRADVASWYARRMQDPRRFAAFVADVPGRGPVSCAIGAVEDHAPSPRNRSGLRGEISNVVTMAEFRHRGLATACLDAVIRWFSGQTPVPTVRLAATADGEALYRRMGFTDPRDVILQLRVQR